MKMLTCADLGSPECHFVAQGNTDEEAVKMMMDHAMTAHKDKLDAMSMSQEDVTKMMMSKVRSM